MRDLLILLMCLGFLCNSCGQSTESRSGRTPSENSPPPRSNTVPPPIVAASSTPSPAIGDSSSIPVPAPTPLLATATIMNGATGTGIYAFGINPLFVKVGTTVTWRNLDSFASHTSTSNTGVWDSGRLAPEDISSFKFDTVGTFPYHCTIHGEASMSGTVIVIP